jgi:DTW domain-containing protein
MYRDVCLRCTRPAVVCYCAHVEQVKTKTRVLFLQHPREARVPIGTARMANLCLPESELRIGVSFDSDRVVAAALADTERPAALLFPGEDARDVRTAPPEEPITLVVIDGTWWQAKKLLRQNPRIAALPKYRVDRATPSRYRIRREPEEHCLATIEALAETLAALEADPSIPARLLAPFEAMVEHQLAYAKSQLSRPRHAKRSGPPRSRLVPIELRERKEDLVLVYGEANAWPYRTPGAPAPEIAHWVAERPFTGERFEAFVAPSHSLSPAFVHNARISADRVMSGESRRSFLERWNAFLRPRDVVVAWGFYATELLGAEGHTAPKPLDLRAAAIRYLGKRAGTIEDMAEVMSGSSTAQAWAEGRAGERLALLAGIARAMS